MRSFRDVLDGTDIDDEPIFKTAMENDGVEVKYDSYFDPDGIAIFSYKAIFEGTPREFHFAAYAIDKDAERSESIGPACEVLLPYRRDDPRAGDFIEELPRTERQKIMDNVRQALLDFRQFRHSVPPYPESVTFCPPSLELLTR
jgi:hypothetical protein